MTIKKPIMEIVLPLAITILIIIGGVYIGYDVIKTSLDACKTHPNKNVTTRIGILQCDENGESILTLDQSYPDITLPGVIFLTGISIITFIWGFYLAPDKKKGKRGKRREE